MNTDIDHTRRINKGEILKKLLKRQKICEEKRQVIASILNYLEYQEVENEDDIYLKQEIKLLYDCILE
uniref:Uncharacterized protein n=1 Tax=viral metagenome TaxID=1070528 RepID=A0A6C0L0K3_9ZZZZ|tara:strand:- start:2202 stop:2405 length:204 start_codon:yes stop_codon:yes gene_type:complete